VRGLRAGHARRAVGAGLRDHALFHGQLRARGVPGAAVPLVDAAAVGAQQAGRCLHRFGCLQAGDRLELRGQRPVRQVLQQRGGRGRVRPRPGQDPAQVLDHIRAGPRALILLRQRDRLLRRARQLQPGEHRAVRAAHARARVAAPAVPDRWRERCQAHAEGARELVRPARVRLREIQRAVLRIARLEVRRLRQVRELALRWRAAVPLLEPRRAAAQVRGDRRAARGEHPHHLPADARDLEAVPVVAGGPFQAEPLGECFFEVLGDDRGDGADVLVVAQGVRGPPFPVGAGLRDVGDLGVDVQLHVPVARGVLQPVRHRQAGLVPLAGLPAVNAGAVGAGAGVAGFPLEVFESGVHGLPDHVVDFGDQGGPVGVAVGIAGLAGQAGVFAQGGVEDRDALGQRDRQVEEQRALPGPADSFGPQLAAAFGGGVRLSGQQRGVQVRGLAAAARGPPQLGSIRGFAVAEQQVIGIALDPLAGLEAKHPGAGAPPAAGRLSPAFAGLDVVAGRVFGRPAVDLLPDVVKVIALAQGRDYRQPAARDRGQRTAELTMLIG
jgi:hypothetical protein